MRTRIKWLWLVGSMSGSMALVHCVGDDPATTPGSTEDAGGGDATQQGDTSTPPNDSGKPIVDAGADSGCAAGVSPCIVQIAGGGQTFCARDNLGAVYCWGSNRDGQLGVDPSTTPFSATPLKIPLTKPAVGLDVGGPRDITDLGLSVACARVTVAVGTPATLECWGSNRFGQLGLPDAGSGVDDAGFPLSATPIGVPGIAQAAVISVSGTHVCSISSAFKAFCWGDNLNGELARPTTNSFDPNPGEVTLTGNTDPNIDDIATGYRSTCITNKLMADRVGCAGQNTVDELGNNMSSAGGNFTDAAIVAVDGPLNNQTFIESNGFGTCALSSGKATCWGENGSGDLGQGATTPGFGDPVSPIGLTGTTPVTGIQSGFDHVCAILGVADPADGGVRQNVYCWGRNLVWQAGQTGGSVADGGFVVTPTPVSGLPDKAIGIASGSQASCALVNGGTVWCWGENYVGELGDRGDGGNDTLPRAPGQVKF